MTEINRYNKGKIYKLVSNQTDKIYVGSTCKDRLCQRLATHKGHYNHWLKNNHKYVSSYELFKLGNVEIVLLETVNCNTKDELLKKECEYIDKYKDILVNKQRPIITKEEEKERDKKYYEDNKEIILEVNKKYREEHKEQKQKQDKEYYEKNKEKRKEREKETMNCDCGSNFRKTDKLRHEKSLKHQKYINSLN